jgi:hypothetical protein
MREVIVRYKFSLAFLHPMDMFAFRLDSCLLNRVAFGNCCTRHEVD